MEKDFVAINYICCAPDYKERFEHLFGTRKGAIDQMPGFKRMQVLRQNEDDGHYLIISHWENQEAFQSFTNSDAFREGHKRGFDDLKAAKARGEAAPMSSDFKT